MGVKTVKADLRVIFVVMTAITVLVAGYAAYSLWFGRVQSMDGAYAGTFEAEHTPQQASIIAAHIRFLDAFGWVVCAEPVEITSVVIPPEFDAVFIDYNAIQCAQGYDLTPYRGQTLEKYVYRVINYPGFETDTTVRADILVFQDKIVGGDICSVRMDGFLHGFQKKTDENDQTG